MTASGDLVNIQERSLHVIKDGIISIEIIQFSVLSLSCNFEKK